MVRDLQTVARDEVLRTTAIASGIKKIYGLNSGNLEKLYKFLNAVIKVCDSIML